MSAKKTGILNYCIYCIIQNILHLIKYLIDKHCLLPIGLFFYFIFIAILKASHISCVICSVVVNMWWLSS